jgi:lipoprotein-anchoring transpeptidase ErfK/SrfK
MKPMLKMALISDRGVGMVGGILTNGIERPVSGPRYHGAVTCRTGRIPALVAAAAVVLSACSGPSQAPRATTSYTPAEPPAAQAVPQTAPTPEPTAGLLPGPHDSISADADSPMIPVFRKPAKGKPFTVLRNPDGWGSRPSFLVKRVRDAWYEVYLPMRPNGVTGWIRARDVTVRLNPYRIEIDLSLNRLTVLEQGEKVMSEPVAAGTGGTPTPTGLFYTTILVKPLNAGGAYGPFAYGLSAYSEVLFTFAGGDGQVAIHGTNDPSSIGNDVSHGCIRMNNAAITKMSKFLPLGTPVDIRP